MLDVLDVFEARRQVQRRFTTHNPPGVGVAYQMWCFRGAYGLGEASK